MLPEEEPPSAGESLRLENLERKEGLSLGALLAELRLPEEEEPPSAGESLRLENLERKEGLSLGELLAELRLPEEEELPFGAESLRPENLERKEGPSLGELLAELRLPEEPEEEALERMEARSGAEGACFLGEALLGRLELRSEEAPEEEEARELAGLLAGAVAGGEAADFWQAALPRWASQARPATCRSSPTAPWRNFARPLSALEVCSAAARKMETCRSCVIRPPGPLRASSICSLELALKSSSEPLGATQRARFAPTCFACLKTSFTSFLISSIFSLETVGGLASRWCRRRTPHW